MAEIDVKPRGLAAAPASRNVQSGDRAASHEFGLGDNTPVFDFNQKALNRQRLSGGGKRSVFRS
jgi:hypothetical protein